MRLIRLRSIRAMLPSGGDAASNHSPAGARRLAPTTPAFTQPALVALVLALLVTLVACASSDHLTAQTASYTVRLALSERRTGERQAIIAIENHGRQPGAIEAVRVLPLMRQHGMASPEVVARPLADGRYQADGVLFSMDGEWQIEVAIDRSDARELAEFQVTIWP